MESSFTFLRIRGIPIGANWSWLFVFALIAWSLGGSLFPAAYPGLGRAAYTTMGLVTAVLFFASILLHELGHAFRALREGMRIEGITLWLFGGVARFAGMFPSPGAEFRIAVAGPAVSVVLAAAFGALTFAAERLGAPATVIGVTDYLARINAIVVAFNLVPALPLDGGRVLRSWLWHRQRSFTAATISASRAGRAFGFMLIAIGILGFFTGAGIGGLWFVVLGWFLLQAAQSEAAFALVRRTFAGARVRDLMTPDPVCVPPDMAVRDFLEDAGRRHSTYPVVDDGRLVGLVSLRLASTVPQHERDRTTVGQVMLGADDVPVLDPDTPAVEAMANLRPAPGRAVVLDDGTVRGIVSVSDVAHALEIGEARGVPEEPDVRRAGVVVWLVVTLVMALAGSLLYHPPVAVIRPGLAVDVAQDITITGVPVTKVNGRYLLTSVRLDQPSALFVALAAVRGDRDVIPLSSLIPPGADTQEFFRRERAVFKESRTVAAAAAAKAAGMDVSLTGTGARVTNVLKGSPAAEVLRSGDVIVAIDGRPISLAGEVGDVIRARPAGTEFTLTVERGGSRSDVRVASARLEREVAPDGIARIGVGIETRGLDVSLPFEIRFNDREIGGPSAGFAYALAIADMLDPADLANGRTIATTGTIDIAGEVGEVGGVREKAAAARAEGAALFLVPAGEVDQAQGLRLEVRGVRTLEEAVRDLAA